MTNSEYPTAVLSMLALAGYPTATRAIADNVAFVCVECGNVVSVTPDATHTRENQRDAIWENFVVDCCGRENMFLI